MRVKAITEKELAAEKPPATGRREVPAGDGLTLRLTANGARTWGVWWRVPRRLGGPERKGFLTLGSADVGTLANARRRAGEALDLARQGLDPGKELARRAEVARLEEARKADLTVAKMVSRRVDAIRGQLRPSTLEQYSATMAVLAESPLAGRLLHEIKRGEVKEALRTIGRQRGMGQARKVKTLVRSAARWAAAEDILPHDVLAGLDFKEAEAPLRDRVLADEEITALWKACDDAPAIMAATVRLQLLLALRHPSETAGMLWADLRKSRLEGFGEVTVYELPAARRKHGIPLSLPLPPLAVDILDSLRLATGQHAEVLHGWSRGRELWWWRKTIRARVLKETGAANFTRHDLRRSVASGMTRIGISVPAADTVLGHKLQGSKRNYFHGARLIEAAGALWKWSAHVERLLGREQGNVLSFAAKG